VDLKSFNGKYFNKNIALNWITTGELNNLGDYIMTVNGVEPDPGIRTPLFTLFVF